MKWIAGIVIAVLTLSAGARAQPKDGDLVLCVMSGARNIVVLDKNTGRLSSLTTGPAAGRPTAVLMAQNNDDVVVAEDTNDVLYSVTPNGTITTLALPGGSCQAGDVMQNGNYVFNTFNSLLEVDSAGNVTTLFSRPPILTASARDQDTDTVLVGFAGVGGALLRWDPRANSVITLCPYGNLSGVDPMPRGWNGNAAYATTGSPRLAICSAGRVTSIATTLGLQALKVDDATGNFFVCGNGGEVQEIDPYTGATINSWGPFAGRSFSGIESYRSRRVAGAGTGAAGSPYAVTLNFGPAAANGSLSMALALAARPGIQIPGVGIVNLAVDPLLILSLQGALNGTILSGFPAALDARGRAGGTIRIPAGLPSGTTFFYSAIAIARQSIVVTANTIGVRVP